MKRLLAHIAAASIVVLFAIRHTIDGHHALTIAAFCAAAGTAIVTGMRLCDWTMRDD